MGLLPPERQQAQDAILSLERRVGHLRSAIADVITGVIGCPDEVVECWRQCAGRLREALEEASEVHAALLDDLAPTLNPWDEPPTRTVVRGTVVRDAVVRATALPRRTGRVPTSRADGPILDGLGDGPTPHAGGCTAGPHVVFASGGRVVRGGGGASELVRLLPGLRGGVGGLRGRVNARRVPLPTARLLHHPTRRAPETPATSRDGA